MLRVDHVEQLAKRAGTLGRTEPEEAGRLYGVVQDRHHLPLQHGLEVDEQVAAADQVHARKRRVRGDVVFGEHAEIPNALGDAVLPVHLVEEAQQPLGRHPLGNTLGIEAGTGPLDHRAVQVGRETLHGPDAPLALHALREGDRE